MKIDHMKVWKAQQLPDVVIRDMMRIAKKVNSMIKKSPPGKKDNPSEWAKDLECWEMIDSTDLKLSNAVINDYMI